jgi:prephenate dehydrogenase
VKAAVLGTGLIGGSIAAALRSIGWHVTGWDPSPETRAQIVQLGLVDRTEADCEAAMSGVELVVLAGPPVAIAGTLRDTDRMHFGDALVMDVGGVKQQAIAAAAGLPRFVGTHPMAGRELGGAGGAAAALFHGALWIITEDGARPEDLDAVEQLVEDMGASPLRMGAAQHDEAVALISHLPQVVASSLVGLAHDTPEAMELASGSFRDLTRVALSDPTLWADILFSNQEFVSRAIGELEATLTAFRQALRDGDRGWVTGRLVKSREARSAMAPPVVGIEVHLKDTPGELAGVGRALAATRCDIRDLQMRHGPHGGGGILTLSVRPGEAPTLRAALATEGFTLT